MMRREPDELRLSRLADRVGSLLELLAHGPLQFGVEVSVAQGVEEDQVDVVGLKRLQPLVQLPMSCAGVFGWSLVTRNSSLRGTGTVFIQPPIMGSEP